MLSVTRITSVEYYEAQDRTALNDAKPGDRQAGRDEVAYYTDNGQAESQGVWWTRSLSNENSPPLLPLSGGSPFGKDGEAVMGRHLRDLAAGRHPTTGEALTQQSANGKRSVGFDVQISAPKSVSVLAGLSDDSTREIIFEAHDRAIRRALDHAFDSGLVAGRRAVKDEFTGSKSYFYEPVAEASAAVYRHFTSRAKDPQLHSHAVLMNVGVRKDGSTGALDNRRLMQYGGALAALYRSELSSILKDELGIETVQKGRNFEIAGIPEDVLKAFSKRRADIEKVAREEGFSTEHSRGKAQVASYETRDEKDREITLDELESRWHRELEQTGWDGNSLMRSAQVEARRIRSEKGEGDETARIDALLLKSIETMTAHHAVIDDRLLQRDALEALQTTCSADEALAGIERLKASGALQQIGETEERPVYSTREIIESERQMLRTAKERQGEREFVPPSAVEAAIAARPTMREDQAEAVRHALNNDGVSIVEGSAGSGKSFSMGAVAEVAREVGFEVHTLAPSWKATEVIRQDTKTAEEYARAVQGFVHRVESGKIVLDPKSVVLVDEAGMVGTTDMARLVEATRKAGAKLVLTGDTRQLQPVVAGAPMVALSRLIGSSRMTEITRQREEWQRAASKDFAAGKAGPALEAYDRRGGVFIGEDREATIERLVADYAKDRSQPEFAISANARPTTRAILSGWNVDVRAINEKVREAGKAAGWIGADDWTIRVYPRGSTEPQAMQFAKGDDVIFGETVEGIGRGTIRNADLGRIVDISGDRVDPTLTIRLAKDEGGELVKIRASGLAGKREEGEEAIPRMQHAAAMTVHAAQGVTVDRAYVANLRGMGQESTYVAMTRHRDAVRLYADGGRIVDALAARDGSAIRQAKGGRTTLPEEEDDRKPIQIDRQAIRDELFKEAAKADRKENASDYFSMRDFLAETPATPPVTVERDATRPLQAQPVADRPAVSPTPFKLDLAGGPKRFQSNAATALSERMAVREASTTRYPVPTGKAELKGRVTQEERDQMVRADLLRFAVDELGGTAVEKWSGGGAVRFGDAKNGEKIGISQKPDGAWRWTVSSGGRRGSGAGVIWDLVGHVKGLDYGASLHWLRDRLRTWRPSGTALNIQRPKVPAAIAQERNDAANIRVGWQRFRAEPSRWLTEERGIRPDILARFPTDVRADSSHERAGNRFGAAFAHRTPDGDLVNYVRRGAPQAGQDQSFRSNAKGGAPTLFMAGDRKPERIYVTESSIDTLSLYQHDGAPEKAMLVAPDGTPGRRSLDAMTEIAKRNPQATWHVGLDNDPKGREFAEQAKEAIRKGNPEAHFEDRSPDPEFKDWNAVVQGKTIQVEADEKGERLRQIEAQRAAEEEARRRQSEEAKNVPQGPRF